MEKFYPKKDNSGQVGLLNGTSILRSWLYGCFKYIGLNGVLYTPPSADGSNGNVLKTNGSGVLSWTSAGAATAWDDLGAPDAAKTHAFTAFTQTFTSTKTDGDMINIKGLGNFGDVSVVRIESATGNPTDGTVLEVVSHDANVDPLVVSALNKANALVVGQGGDVAIANALTVTGALKATSGITAGTATTSAQFTDVVTVTAAQVKALKTSAKELVAAPGANKLIEFVSAAFLLDYGSEVFTESEDNLVIEYSDGADVSDAIDSTGTLTAEADTAWIVYAKNTGAVAASASINKSLVLKNTGDGEIGGNASEDSVLKIRVTYRVHSFA